MLSNNTNRAIYREIVEISFVLNDIYRLAIIAMTNVSNHQRYIFYFNF